MLDHELQEGEVAADPQLHIVVVWPQHEDILQLLTSALVPLDRGLEGAIQIGLPAFHQVCPKGTGRLRRLVGRSFKIIIKQECSKHAGIRMIHYCFQKMLIEFEACRKLPLQLPHTLHPTTHTHTCLDFLH